MTPAPDPFSAAPPGPDWLFCPADRPERFAKAAAAAASVIIDLEDGVVPDRKASARGKLGHAVSSVADPARLIVRINAVDSPEHRADLLALRENGLRTVMLPKAESAEQLTSLAGFRVVALCETPRGILEAASIARAENCIALMWGSEDLAAALGAASSRRADGSMTGHAAFARNSVLYAAAAAGRLAIDAVYLDLDGLAREARDAAESGFDVKAVIHPSHCAGVRAAFTPTPEQLSAARRVVDAAAASAHGVFSLDGRHIDEPLVRQARRVLARNGATTP
ncbi:MAG: citrate lyase subunit beta / citryl-CoA lyase [Pseudonocardiales bacterium]|jgi:citrate lyase subunit beta/citryl-CoA lyase|nr:citrate lyase subunit beta / citryl-CoA lyase [Pseudonocardiales bacterium]